jgi:hypothetical protein
MPFSVGLVRRALATKPTFKTRYKFVPLPLDFLPHVLMKSALTGFREANLSGLILSHPGAFG